MFRISWILLFAAFASGQTSERTLMAGRMKLGSGAVFSFRSVLRPAYGAEVGFLGVGDILRDSNDNVVHRYMVDSQNHTYFGYDVTVGKPDSTGGFLVTFGPLSHVEHLDDATTGMRLIVLPKYPAPQMVHDDERIELDLMESPDGTRKLTDIIAIRMHDTWPLAPTTAPRDYTVDDGPIAFDCRGCTFSTQGRQEPSAFTGKRGATLWVAVPGHGRYLLSMVPHEGFAKAGVVRGNSVQFEDGGQKYEVQFQNPIAGAGEAWNVYVMHDPGYSTSVMVQMGTDRLENLIAKH